METLFDGNDCTGFNSAGTPGLCNSSTGQVTHQSLPFGTACGDPADTTCTNPDTCDGTGNCVPNNDDEEGNFCEADGDVCTRDRCVSGVCAFVQFEDNGSPCDDGQDNCSPGQDICLAGACLGGGTDPCAAPPGGFCLELEQVGPSCPNGDIDCAGFPDSTCQIDPDNPNDPPRCRRPYTCAQCRPGMDDCPDDGDCFAPTCTADGHWCKLRRVI